MLQTIYCRIPGWRQSKGWNSKMSIFRKLLETTCTSRPMNTVTNEWLPICPCSWHCSLTDGLVVAAPCPPTHHHVVTSSTHLLPDLRQLAALSLTTECQGHSRKLRLVGLLAEACSPASGWCSSSEAQDIWPQHAAQGSTNHLRAEGKLCGFKSALKTHLFRCAYPPNWLY